MAAFEFVALDEQGRQRKGLEEADSVRQVRQGLRDRGWVPLSVEEGAARTTEGNGDAPPPRSLFSQRGLAARDLALLTRQLATLLQAGLPVEESLQAVSRQNDKPRIKKLLLDVRAGVLEGRSLAQSMDNHAHAFSDLYRATVAAGEATGYLGIVMNNLADYTERRFESRQQIQMAMLYPVILTLFAVLIVVGLLTWVVPDIVKVFEDTGQELPALTQGLLALSGFLQDWGVTLLIGAVVLMFAMRRLMRTPNVQLRVHRAWLGWPLIGRFARESNASRFASTLAILGRSGVPLVEALRIAGEVLSNTWLRRQMTEVTARVTEGSSLSRAMEESGQFPPMVTYMIASGEASGELDDMLDRAARSQENELRRFTETLIGLFQPFMLVTIAIVVFLIVIAILVPILNLNQMVL